MDNLLASAWHASVKNAQPSHLKNDADKVPFREAFKDAVAYFTQFIKVHDWKVINRSFLWLALARGAAILCADNQAGLDIIIPILIRDGPLARKNVTAIIIQVKNKTSFGANPFRVLFDLMNPYRIGFYDHDEEDTLPVIRMVFSLGAKKSKVEVIQAAQRKQPQRKSKDKTEKKSRSPPKFTSYDIWCANASTKTFSVIESNDTFTELLKKDKAFPRLYKSEIEVEDNLRRQMHALAMSDSAHWRFAGQSVPAGDKVVPDYMDDIDDAKEEV
jgi:hypothetical protein